MSIEESRPINRQERRALAAQYRKIRGEHADSLSSQALDGLREAAASEAEFHQFALLAHGVARQQGLDFWYACDRLLVQVEKANSPQGESDE